MFFKLLRVSKGDSLYINFSFKMKNIIQNTIFHTGKEKTIRKDTLQWKYKCLDTNVNSNRYKAFAEFDKKINKYPEIILYYNAKELKSKFDFFITGSDQVWNWAINWFFTLPANYFEFPQPLHVTLLRFVSDGKPRIAYAASLSCPYIPDGLKDLYFSSILCSF